MNRDIYRVKRCKPIYCDVGNFNGRNQQIKNRVHFTLENTFWFWISYLKNIYIYLYISIYIKCLGIIVYRTKEE